MKLGMAALTLLIISSSTALAQRDDRYQQQPAGKAASGSMFKGTQDEQAACKPDATKFCLDDMPDTFRVLACLQQNRQKLRKVCLQVLESHGQ